MPNTKVPTCLYGAAAVDVGLLLILTSTGLQYPLRHVHTQAVSGELSRAVVCTYAKLNHLKCAHHVLYTIEICTFDFHRRNVHTSWQIPLQCLAAFAFELFITG